MAERALLILVAIVTLMSAVRANPGSKLGVLQLDNRLKREADMPAAPFTGKYVSLQGDGIHFHTNRGYLSVSTLDGKPAFFASFNQLAGAEGFGYVSINDQRFAHVDNKAYALRGPVDVQTLLSHSERKAFAAKLQEDDHRAHAAVAETSLADLAKSREAALMIEASFVLGKEYGINGRDNPEALPLHGIAMQLATMRHRENIEDAAVEGIICGDKCPSEGCPAPSKDGDYTPCEPTDSYTACPPCHDNECYGMCGKDCCCMDWVCGDCCWHQYCHDHDVCCTQQGFFNPLSMCVRFGTMVGKLITAGCDEIYAKC